MEGDIFKYLESHETKEAFTKRSHSNHHLFRLEMKRLCLTENTYKKHESYHTSRRLIRNQKLNYIRRRRSETLRYNYAKNKSVSTFHLPKIENEFTDSSLFN